MAAADIQPGHLRVHVLRDCVLVNVLRERQVGRHNTLHPPIQFESGQFVVHEMLATSFRYTTSRPG